MPLVARIPIIDLVIPSASRAWRSAAAIPGSDTDPRLPISPRMVAVTPTRASKGSPQVRCRTKRGTPLFAPIQRDQAASAPAPRIMITSIVRPVLHDGRVQCKCGELRMDTALAARRRPTQRSFASPFVVMLFSSSESNSRRDSWVCRWDRRDVWIERRLESHELRKCDPSFAARCSRGAHCGVLDRASKRKPALVISRCLRRKRRARGAARQPLRLLFGPVKAGDAISNAVPQLHRAP
jgi:hypothetical protein